MEMIRCTRCMAELKGNVKFCPQCGYCQNSDSQPENALKRNTILNGRYLVGNVIGQGGFGITYVGYDLVLDMKVAVKEYYPTGSAMRSSSLSNNIQWDLTGSDQQQWSEGLERFLKEAKKMAKLDSVPAIVRVRDAFRENQTAYIVMDFVEGVTLKSHLQQHGVMKPDLCIRLLTPVMESLAIIHEQGFIHRDISPDNIMVEPSGSVRLLDLGAAVDVAASKGHASMAVVKRNFSAPEQYLETESLGSWTDVYAMSATIYYCITGKTVPEAMEREIKGPQLLFDPVLAIPEPLQMALNDGLRLRPQSRIPNMKELLRRLNGAPAPYMSNSQIPPNNIGPIPPNRNGNVGPIPPNRNGNAGPIPPSGNGSTIQVPPSGNGGTGGGNSSMNGFNSGSNGPKKSSGKRIAVLGGIAAACVILICAFAFVFKRSDEVSSRDRDDKVVRETTEKRTKRETTERETKETETAERETKEKETKEKETTEKENEPEEGTSDDGPLTDYQDDFGFWTINDDGTCELTLYLNAMGENVEIPKEYDGHKVTSIGDFAFIDSPELKQVRIPNTVTSIGTGIFAECPSIQVCFIPKSVTTIEGPLVEDTFTFDILYVCEESKANIQNLDWNEKWMGNTSNWVIDYGAVFGKSSIGYDGWQEFNGNWLFIEDGFATIGWKVVDGNTYYFNSRCEAVKGWGNAPDETYYFDPETCIMLKGWQEIEGNWYYFDMKDGHMLKNTTTPDGYKVDSDGIYHK